MWVYLLGWCEQSGYTIASGAMPLSLHPTLGPDI